MAADQSSFVMAVRKAAGRAASPSAGVIDPGWTTVT